MKKCIELVTSKNLWRDARSTKYKTLTHLKIHSRTFPALARQKWYYKGNCRNHGRLEDEIYRYLVIAASCNAGFVVYLLVRNLWKFVAMLMCSKDRIYLRLHTARSCCDRNAAKALHENIVMSILKNSLKTSSLFFFLSALQQTQNIAIRKRYLLQ